MTTIDTQKIRANAQQQFGKMAGLVLNLSFVLLLKFVF